MSRTFGSPLAELVKTRIRAFFREPGAVFWVFFFPLLMALALGFAFREKKSPDRIPIGAVKPNVSAPILRALQGSPRLNASLYDSEDSARRALRTGKISLLVEQGPPPHYRLDPTRPDARAARLEVDEVIQRALGRSDAAPASEEIVHEKGSRYIDFLMPGILGLNLMGTGMWGIGFSIVTGRIRKTLKLLTATPMRRSDYMLSHILARIVFLFVELPVLLAFGYFLFGVPIRGSILLLVATAFLGAMTFAGIGLLTCSRAETMEVGSGLMNAVMIPMWLVSGTFFSADRFPKAFQPVIQALPLTALNNALRSVMIEGAGLAEILGKLLLLAAWAIVTFVIALKIFKWQ
jgi:ABC-type multidrug transport system permease subunit